MMKMKTVFKIGNKNLEAVQIAETWKSRKDKKELEKMTTEVPIISFAIEANSKGGGNRENWV